MQRLTVRIWWRACSPRSALNWQAGRVAWLGAVLMTTSLPGGRPASVPVGGGSPGRQQVFQLAGPRLAPTRAG
jgi:hypothetical protein